MKIELIDDIVTIEIGRVINDGDYGNYRMSIRIPVRSNDLHDSIIELQNFVTHQIDSWKKSDQETALDKVYPNRGGDCQEGEYSF